MNNNRERAAEDRQDFEYRQDFDYRQDFEYLPTPADHAKECWEWLREVLGD